MTRTLALLALGLALIVTTAHATPPVVVPYYGATYGTPGGFSAADAKRVVELLESIDRRLESIEQRTPGGPAAVRKGPDLFAIAKANCAACHTQATAEKSGGGFVLFEKDEKSLRSFGAREKTRITEAVQSGAMPPDGRKKLSPADKAAFKW